MIFVPTGLPGAFVIEPQRIEDARGFFARIYCQREFAAHGLETAVAQSSISLTKRKGTLRGMHYQIAPFEEAKLVRCNRGAIHDVIIDLRHDSPSYKDHFSVELNEENGKMLYIPRGFAHGFQTLVDNSEIYYQMSQFFSPDHARGIRWNDPIFGITWPFSDLTIADRDRNYPNYLE